MRAITPDIQKFPKQLSLFDRETLVPLPAFLLTTPRRQAEISERTLHLEGGIWSYELRRGKRRTIGLTIMEQGLVIHAPRWVSQAQINDVINSKSAWLAKKLNAWQTKQNLIQSKRTLWKEGGVLQFLGREIRLHFSSQFNTPLLQAEIGTLNLPLAFANTPERAQELVQSWCQRQAFRLFVERVTHYAQALGTTVKKVSLSSALRHWGTARADGVIRLNWRLIQFPPHIIDYVVAHETAHLLEMNHSPRFWKLVESVCKDYREARAYLQREVCITFD